MSFETQCLICDSLVEEGRHGNLISMETGLRGRVEKILGRSLEQSPRCCSLCLSCEQSINTIEEYYRHLEEFQKTYASTAAKYGEAVISKPELDDVEVEGGGEVGALPSWTICLQASDGSLVPLQQSVPGMIMADDNQVVLETVTVESSEVNQGVLEGTECEQGVVYTGEEDVQATGALTENSMVDVSIEQGDEGDTSSQVKDVVEPLRPSPSFTCAHCNARYEEADNLQIHERSSGHSGNYNYKCGICGNIYARLDSLRDHMCRHTGQKPHKCEVCGESFSFRNQLSRHRVAHYQPGPANIAAMVGTSAGSATTDMLDTSAISVEGVVQVQDGRASVTGTESIISTELVQDIQNILGSSEVVELVQTPSGCVKLVQQQQQVQQEEEAPGASPTPVPECPRCKKTFPSHTGLQRHQCPMFRQNAKFEESSFPCPKCKSVFPRRVGLERHRCPALNVEGMRFKSEEAERLEGQAMATSKVITTEGESGGGGGYQVLSHSPRQQPSEDVNDIVIEVSAPNICGEGDDTTYTSEGMYTTTTPQVDSGGNDTSIQQPTPVPHTPAPATLDTTINTVDPDLRCLACKTVFTSEEELALHMVECVRRLRTSLGKDNNISPVEASLTGLEEVAVDVEPTDASRPVDARPEEENLKDNVIDQGMCEVETSAVTRSELEALRHLQTQGQVATGEDHPEVLLYENPTTSEAGGDVPKPAPMVEAEGVEGVMEGDIGEEIPGTADTGMVSELDAMSSTQLDSTTDSLIRRSSRAAGKVNPILEMLRKKKRPLKPNDTTSFSCATPQELSSKEINSDTMSNETPKRKRGRPPKVNPTGDQQQEPGKDDPEAETPVKRKRGRPRKYERIEEAPTPPVRTTEGCNDDKEDGGEIQPEKRKRGRPRKVVPLETSREEGEGECDKEHVGHPPPVEGSTDAPPVGVGHTGGETQVKQEETGKENLPIRRTRLQPKRYSDHILGESGINSDDDVDNSYDPSDDKAAIKRTLNNHAGGEQSVQAGGAKYKEEFFCESCVRSFSCAAALKKHEKSSIHLRGKNTPGNRKYTCKVCGRGFMKIDHLRDHSVNHTGELPHSCHVCDKKFKFRSQLALHRTSAHTQGEIEASFKSNPMSRRRRRYKNAALPPEEERDDPRFKPEVLDPLEQDGDVMFRCKICNTWFNELRLFNRHVVSHFKVKPFKCDICSKEFARADTLRCHKKVHYGGEVPNESGMYLCGTCGRQFMRVDALRSHVKMHYGQRPWKCKDCGKSFVDRHTLARHVVIHQSQKPFLCATCGRGFNRKSHLEVHEAQHSGIHLHKCEICHRTFNEPGNLTRHMIVHSDARPWPCTVCGERFKRKGNLDEHQLTHNKERQAVCDICGARFNTKRYLRIHQLIHSGDRPHKCITCLATFRQLSALITHKRIHTGHAPYQCTKCEKKFKYYDQWKAHEYSHSDAKPYKCSMCNATYRQAGSLRQHRKVAHGNQKLSTLFWCAECNKTFSSTVSLERHMKRVHGAQSTIQSIQTIGDIPQQPNTAVVSDKVFVPTSTSTMETSNIVHITNPQGGLETIELTNISGDNSAANIVQLLNGQTLTTLNGSEVTMGQDGSVQFADGQRFYQLVNGLGDGSQVINISGGNGQVISIAGLTQEEGATGGVVSDDHHQGGVAVSGEDGVLQYAETETNPQHTTVVQAFVEAVSHLEPTEGHSGPVEEVLTQEIQVSQAANEETHDNIHIQTIAPKSSIPCVVEVNVPTTTLDSMSDNMQHQIASTQSLVPIEVVPMETTITTMEEGEVHGDVDIMETVETTDTLHVITDGHGELITDGVTHELAEQVVETVSIATTSYEPVAEV